MPPAVVFTTPRLTVRPWQVEEAGRLLDIRRRRDVARWLSDPRPWDDLATAQGAIAEWSRVTPPLGTWAIVPTSAALPVGTIALSRLPGGDEVQITWYLHPDARGRGVAAEAARGAIDHALGQGIPRVWAIMWPDNDASARVAAVAGMTDLGIRPDPWYGTTQDPDARMFRADAPRQAGRPRRIG